MSGIALAAVAALLLTGCAEPRARTAGGSPRVEDARTEAPHVTALLDFAANLKNRTASDAASELESLNRTYAQHRTEDNRLRLALFHALVPGGDRAKALSLLDLPPGENVGRGRGHPIAMLMIPLLQENRRIEESAAVAQQRLRDEQKRSEGLQLKLDAIREIEKKMVERSTPQGPGAPLGSPTGKTP